ncbi:LysR family transcriptional regulator [Ochrobactrum sp. SFR4]|uniref:LysR family transcriptional regulator n=1 Tax=Ochrobactrum sp. SFR4 TaxID=2717368 RepID=UPI001C8B52CC|nr:LysR family transcriptional regulator [Ochrobactrum sp. SFR4]MBX8824032.1 LysR family transcriptional regulator [Ochrobactrum sp. SFR4]
MNLDRMGDIIAFVRTADARSFTVAAEQLGLSRSAVGKRIARLEERLGLRLLHRTTRSVGLSDEGAAFYDRCQRILADLDEAEAAMATRREEPRGRLRIDVPFSFGRLHILPVLHRFMAMWPELAVNVSFNDRYIDLIDEGIDLAIRIGGADDSRLMARTLAPHRLVTCATPAYLEAHGVPSAIEDLAAHSCLAFMHAGRPADWRFLADGKMRTLPVHGRFCAGNAEALRDGVLAGYGIGQLATFLVGEDVRAGRLIPVLKAFTAEGEPIRAVYPSPRHLSPKVRRFIDLIVESWSPLPDWDH